MCTFKVSKKPNVLNLQNCVKFIQKFIYIQLSIEMVGLNRSRRIEYKEGAIIIKAADLM